MSTDRIMIPKGLLGLKPSDALESVPMSTLARTGTSVLQQIVATTQAMMVSIQGQGSMVTLSQRQYDEIITFIDQLQKDQTEDGFTLALSQRFDELVANMNQPGAVAETDAALFGKPDDLNKTYRPGMTEIDD